MTSARPGRKPTDVAMRFLLEDFIAVPEQDRAPKTVRRFQARAARFLLPGPRGRKAAFSPQQLALMQIDPAEFQQLRRDVREWLGAVVFDPRRGHRVQLKGPLDLWLVTGRGEADLLRRPLVEGSPRDVFWFYLVHLISRAGVAAIGVCRAPRSKRDPRQHDPQLRGATEECERLFLKRGRAKLFCSETCRARVATQKARKGRTQ